MLTILALNFQLFRSKGWTESMANIAQQRIQREFREVVKSKEIAESGVQLELVSPSLKGKLLDNNV
jgi:hypothetical protein